MKRFLVLFFSLLVIHAGLLAQDGPAEAKTYTLAGLEVEGAEYSDKNAILSISGLRVGDLIAVPGIQVSDAIKRLWKENIFSDVSVRADNIAGDKIFLVVVVKERPRISKFSFQGVSKAQADDLREQINFIRGTILTESKKQSAKRVIRNFFVEKGFFNTSVEITEETDNILRNGVVVNIRIDKGDKIHINEIVVQGNEVFPEKKVERKLKKVNEQRWWKFWATSKYVPKTFSDAKGGLIEAYNEEGYRDAQITFDTIYRFDERHVDLVLRVDEGQRYYHRNISWSGNLKYNAEFLNTALGIKKGDVYSRAKIDKRLFGDPNGADVSSLYLDNGYLFFNLNPVEVAVVGDSIDLEMRVAEGPQATIRNVIIEGNTKTSDFVVRRELRTAPGQKFSRSDIIRSQREILNLGFFDQEKLGVAPIPDPESGTVDIKYTVEERASDQLQLQGGWSARVTDPNTGDVLYGGFLGTVLVAFNNFSTRRIFQPDAWRPVPSGDGQKVSLSMQFNGTTYKNFSFTFQEPWLGGKKPNSLGVSASYLVFQSNIGTDFFSRNNILNVGVDFGQRLKFPDDFFTARTTLGYKYYDIINPELRFNGFEGEPAAYINILTLRQSLDRSSVDAPLYPRSGSQIHFSVEATPPYSLFRSDNTDYSEMTDAQKYQWLEYVKFRFSTSWFFRIVGDMVLNTKIEAGYLGAYNSELGISPFERYYLGGAGLMGSTFGGFDGREILPLRGYENNSLTNNNAGYPIYNRLVAELRYPITLNQSAPVWVLAFMEGGNGYGSFREYSPFDLKRSAGAGIRVMLPMVGLLGLDWAYGFDRLTDTSPNVSGSQFHFMIGQQF
ncbi:POTRA domain-containing protein [Pontibacter sp. G13]|uniref:BamA/OMP85 family outer membrane protein n=1 Tax=Pontibacter sp. G13 TaxID=3074898 RepID=UPI00288B5CA3|nr:POTRA domain-containing protein [Pontibacter sp. G13]WNJ16489.1 POTRA domain-containing protein [Pontibacter sp. G13]